MRGVAMYIFSTLVVVLGISARRSLIGKLQSHFQDKLVILSSSKLCM
jgi:hypothetical protein